MKIYLMIKNTMIKIKNKGLNLKNNIKFPINSKLYKNNINNNFKLFKPINYNTFSKEMIINNPNLIPHYEKLLKYI